jgi:hypothetical protein
MKRYRRNLVVVESPLIDNYTWVPPNDACTFHAKYSSDVGNISVIIKRPVFLAECSVTGLSEV